MRPGSAKERWGSEEKGENLRGDWVRVCVAPVSLPSLNHNFNYSSESGLLSIVS